MLRIGTTGGGNDFVNRERSRATVELLGVQREGTYGEQEYSCNEHVPILADSPLTLERLPLSYLGTPWPMVVALYRQALPMQESDRIDFLQKHCGVRTPLYYEVRSLLAGTEPRVWIEN